MVFNFFFFMICIINLLEIFVEVKLNNKNNILIFKVEFLKVFVSIV